MNRFRVARRVGRKGASFTPYAVRRALVVGVLALAASSAPAQVSNAPAQVPLLLANERTTIRDIDFAFEDAQTFERELLRRQIAAQGPGFVDRLKAILPFVSPKVYPLDRIEVQKDVVRLRRFYRQNGFLAPYIHYRDSRLDTTDNDIGLVFTIREGPPIIIQDVGFYSPEGNYATSLFEGAMRDRWIRFRDQTSFKTGDRYTDVDLVRIQDQVLVWLKDNGYAFARFDTTEALIDSTFNTADISFFINPGPLTYFDEVLVEGNERVSDTVVRRELPFRRGERFSNSKLIQGQRELFALNLFRVALADVPPVVDDPALLRPGWQLRDSTVTVRFRVREAAFRYLTAETGYAADLGLTLAGQWTHRNFAGGARNLTLNASANSGFLASPPAGTEPPRLFRASVALRQPYVFTGKLSAIVEPFILYERDPLLRNTELPGKINRRELGVSTTLIYDILPFRTVSLQYSLSRAVKFAGERADTTGARDAYSKSVVSLNGTFGWTNNFFNPRRGFLVRPFVEDAGGLERGLGLGPSGIEYVKLGSEVVGYIPITRRISLGTRLMVGRIWPTGDSRHARRLRAVDAGGGAADVAFDALFVEPLEDRFDPVRFYAGGADDVRGWDWRLIGPRINRTEAVRDEAGNVVLGDDGLPLTRNEQYEAIGGRAKLLGNAELRFPFPGLGNAWRAAVFLDFGQVSSEEDPAQDCRGRSFFAEETDGTLTPVEVQCGFKDEGTLALSKFKYGVGAGIRYETPVGYIRLDVAYKVNPDPLDLRRPREAFLFEQELIDDPGERFLRRFNIHLSLGQAF